MSNALQHAFAAIDAGTKEATDDGLTAAKAKALMVGYDARWFDAGYETLSVEEVFHLPIINPATGHPSRTHTQAGKYDGKVRRDGKKFLLEHKTSSDDISDPNSTYWRRMAIDSQVSMYILANWQGEEKLDGTLYDVIKKPTIRPKELSKAAKQSILMDRKYFGTIVSEAVCEAIAMGTQERECSELFYCRLAADTLERPDHYYQRRLVPRLDNEITEWADELWDVARDIHEARKHGRHYRNTAACMAYNSPCEYLGICSGYDNPDSDKWQTREQRHSELTLPKEVNPLNVITNSRVRCFQTCKRKHYYRYEMGLQRQDEEERDALYFGSTIHFALEAWFSCFFFPTEVSDGNAIGSPVNGVGGPVSNSQEIVAG